MRRKCPERADYGLCETDDERNARDYGLTLPTWDKQAGWLCWTCGEEVAGEVIRCDGSLYPVTAIPPLPLHDWRFNGDDPYTVCARCGERRDAITGKSLGAVQ